MTIPPPLGELIALLKADAAVDMDVDAPFHPDGIWWLVLQVDGDPFDVSWQEGKGFGLFLQSPEFGGRPDEICTEASRCSRRLLQIAAARRVGERRSAPNLRDVRQLYGVSQVELAKALGVDQAAISRMERKADPKLSAMQQYVAALGGQLELTVRFSDYSAPIGAQ